MDFVTADAVFAIRDQPYCGKPFIQGNRAILEDGSNLDGELPLGVLRLAFPEAASGDKTQVLRLASRAYCAIREDATLEELKAALRIGKVCDGLLESFWFGCHVQTLSK